MSSSLASTNPLVEQCRGYFERHLPSLIGQLLIEDISGLDAAFGIRVTDTPDPAWILIISDGRLASVSHEAAETACVFCLQSRIMLDIVAGKLKPDEAFFNFQIQVEGDMELGLMLSTVLAPFFERYAYTG